jgi:hypothetical protein
MLRADSHLKKCHVLDASVTYEEIFALANSRNVYPFAAPPPKALQQELKRARSGLINPPGGFEKRFHVLSHTELFKVSRTGISFHVYETKADKDQLLQQFEALESIDKQFTGFDPASTAEDIVSVVRTGDWGRYFDGLISLPGAVVKALGAPITITKTANEPEQKSASSPTPAAVPPLQERKTAAAKGPKIRKKGIPADPEATRVKRERRNFAHKLLVGQMDDLLRKVGAIPQESEHIDLYAKVPQDGSFIFEMKSGGENLLEQIRKGLAQLYEYKFRYKNQVEPSAHLCLVLGAEPMDPSWLIDYICNDRKLSICWFGEGGQLLGPTECDAVFAPLKSGS